MENVAHGGAQAVHHHEVELSIWPLIVGIGAFLVPISFMVHFSWEAPSTFALLGAGVAVVLLLVGLFGWVNEVHAKKEEVGLSKVAIVVFIISEVALFGGLFGGYFYTMLLSPSWPPVSTPEGVPPIELALLLTFFLVTSSAWMHMAETKLEHGDMGGFKTWLSVTFLFGLAFLVGMAYEWNHLIGDGFNISVNTYGTFFYTITGFHGSHVIVGLALQAFLMILALGGKISKKKQTLTKVTGLYWHFVDIVWLLVLSMIYVIPYFKVGQ
ncbi:MAG: heme-copper oxidase subunit III [Nitrospirae bacterium]|nr:heme-copper oxidase subunit III [Nitrospirota bacterium]